MSEDKKKDIEELSRDISIRSEDVQEIMGFIPHWIIRWGITLITMVVILLLIGSWFFQYPDIISSSIVLTTENPPATLVARSSGKISELFVEDKQPVKKGNLIAIIENATNHHQLFELKKKLDRLVMYLNDFEKTPDIYFNQNTNLGELQATYASFLKTYGEYQHFISLRYHQNKINAINSQISQYKLLYQQLKDQAQIMAEQLNLSLQEYKRLSTLNKDGIIPKSELDKANSNYLQMKHAYQGAQSNVNNSKIQINQLEQQVMELDLNYKEEKKRIQLSLKQVYENLTSSIDQWEYKYLLKAPISGVITFNKFWSVLQNVTIGDKVFTIIPANGGKIIGKVILPLQGSGKVKVGQKVNIKFTNYPHMDYGIVSGIIISKSLVAADNFYSLEVELPNALKTSYGKILEFTQEMQGTAEIITEEIRLLERIFKPIKSILTKM